MIKAAWYTSALLMLSFLKSIEPATQVLSLSIYIMRYLKYAEYGFNYIMTIYKDERLRIYYSMLEDMEDTFFIALHYAKEACEKVITRQNQILQRSCQGKRLPCMLYGCYRDKLFKDPKYADEEAEA